MGAIPSLNVQELKDSHSYFPILAEQIIIGKFLDKKTKEIDNIISRKEQLIERLEEYKKSVITEAVTKGKLGNKYLNVEGKLVDEIEMKDSGVEWIGEIPEYWSINKVKFNSIINPLKSEINIKLLNEVSFIPMEYLKEGYISKQDYKKTVDVYKGYTYFKEGDILLAKVTPCFENGNIAIANNIKNNIGFATTEVHVIRTIGDSNKYLFYLFQSDQFIEKGKSVMYGAGGLKRVSTEFLENFQFPRPNIIAQQILTEYIDMKINKIQILIKKTKKSIQKYKEYKKSLIFEAVTGKIDLRDYEVERSEENVR
jgi:type I restriction enzyme S subunit